MEIIRCKKTTLSLDLAPLIDVVFQLLVFFMLTATFSQPSINLKLPKAVTKDVYQQERIMIEVSRQGQISINGTRLSKEKLSGALKSHLSASKDKSVHIKGDQDMSYKYFVEIVDLSRQAGARQVNVVHEPGERR